MEPSNKPAGDVHSCSSTTCSLRTTSTSQCRSIPCAVVVLAPFIVSASDWPIAIAAGSEQHGHARAQAFEGVGDVVVDVGRERGLELPRERDEEGEVAFVTHVTVFLRLRRSVTVSRLRKLVK